MISDALAGQYDGKMVALSLVIAICASWVGFMANRRFFLQRQLPDSELERWSLLISSNLDGLFDADFTSGEVFYSPRWMAMRGYAPDE